MIPIPILFFRGEKIKIDPKLSSDERKKFIRKTLKRVWLETAITFFIGEIILFFMFYQDILSGDTSLSVVIITELMLVFASVLLCVLDGVKLILQNRKINKQQKNHPSDSNPSYQRDNYSYYSKYFEGIFTSDKDIPPDKREMYSKYVDEVTVRQIYNSKRTEDPLIGVKIGADEIWHSLLSALTRDGKINVTEIMLWTSGLAGYACQMLAWEKAGIPGNSPEFVVFTTTDGRNFYTGDAINNPLITNKYSVWHLAAETYHELEPAKPLPDIDYLVDETINLVTDKNYEMWGQVSPYEMLSKYKHVWDDALGKKITGFCKVPDEWPILFGFIVQNTIQLVIKGMPSDQSCLEMMMRNALFTSRLDIKNAAHPNPAK